MNLLLLALVLAGIAGGFLAGLLGIGGGIIFILILPVVLKAIGVPEQELVQYVIANSLFGTFAASLTGAITLWRKSSLYLKDTVWVALSAVIVSLLSLEFIVTTTFYSQQVFTVVVVVFLLLLSVSILRSANQVPTYHETMTNRIPYLSASGFAGGLLASLSGLGGGAIIVPILNTRLRMDMHRARAISLGVIVLSALCMTVFNVLQEPRYSFTFYNTGYLIWPIAALLSVGVIIGSPMGVRVGNKLPSSKISQIFSLFLLIVLGTKLWSLWQIYF